MLIQDLLQEACKWTGYLEKKDGTAKYLDDFTANAGTANYTRFNRDYMEYWGGSWQAQPWCAMFVSCVFRYAFGKELQEKLMTAFTYCPTGVNSFKQKGQWVTVNPQPGDVIFFKSATSSDTTAVHVGIVRAADSGRVYTVEGNTSGGSTVIANGGGVAQKSYALSYAGILGYGRPDYTKYEEKETVNMDEFLKKLNDIEAELDYVKVKYNWIDTNMPEWARPTISKLYDKGILKGNENGELRLSDCDLRHFVVNDRAGLYD